MLALLVAVVGPMASIADSAKQEHGLLRVRTSPEVPAQIFLGGIMRNTAEMREVSVPAGDHQVCFGSVKDHVAPPCQSFTVVAGELTEIVGEFEPSGTVDVIADPSIEAPITVNGFARDTAAVRLDLGVGTHQVCFGDVPGYETPACQRVEVSQGDTVSVVGTYEDPPADPPSDGPDDGDGSDEPSPGGWLRSILRSLFGWR